jgi:hypothetical protein
MGSWFDGATLSTRPREPDHELGLAVERRGVGGATDEQFVAVSGGVAESGGISHERADAPAVVEVDSGQERELLYLGGNADLYVLVDHCDDAVHYVSVGATRLQVIDELTC